MHPDWGGLIYWGVLIGLAVGILFIVKRFYKRATTYEHNPSGFHVGPSDYQGGIDYEYCLCCRECGEKFLPTERSLSGVRYRGVCPKCGRIGSMHVPRYEDD